MGGGRVGQALADMGSGTDVLVRRGAAVSGPAGPIVVCTRNDDLQSVVDATPPERRQGKLHLQLLLLPLLGMHNMALWVGTRIRPSGKPQLGVDLVPTCPLRLTLSPLLQILCSFRTACCSPGLTRGGWGRPPRWAGCGQPGPAGDRHVLSWHVV